MEIAGTVNRVDRSAFRREGWSVGTGAPVAADCDHFPGAPYGRRQEFLNARDLIATGPAWRADAHRGARPCANAATHTQGGIDSGDQIRTPARPLDHLDCTVGTVERTLQAPGADVLVHGRRCRPG